MRYIKTFENMTISGNKFKDPYFEEDMWYIGLVTSDDATIIFEKEILKYSRILMKIFKNNDVEYRLVYHDPITFNIPDLNNTYGVYFMINKENLYKIEDKIILPLIKKPNTRLSLVKIPKKFEYPDNFEDCIIHSMKDIENRIELRHNMEKYNV